MMRRQVVMMTVALSCVSVVDEHRCTSQTHNGTVAQQDTRAESGATAQLVAHLKSETQRRPGYGDDNYWARHDYGPYWSTVESLIERGADATAAFKDGANIWEAVFVGDPRCICAPYGWPGTHARGCTNPAYFRGCADQERAGFERRIAFLLNHAVDPNLELTDAGESPLCRAGALHLHQSVKLLVARGASCSASCVGSFLRGEAESKRPRSLCALIRCGAPLNATEPDGKTALHVAAQHGLIENVDKLLDHGADPSLKDSYGDDVMSIARRNRRASVVHLLTRWIKTGAQPTHSKCLP